jgi:hypothetical protein
VSIYGKFAFPHVQALTGMIVANPELGQLITGQAHRFASAPPVPYVKHEMHWQRDA